MSKSYDGWQNALSVLDEVQPPFFPDDAEVTMVVADLPPGSAGFAPHRHSGPSFYYQLEGELRFELDGEPPRVMRAGDAFWEPGGDVTHHTNGNNRDDMRCRFVIVMVSAPNRPPSEPVPSRRSPTESEAGQEQSQYDGRENAVTVLPVVRPPLVPERAHAVTVMVEHPPGSAGTPPHRHSGPVFGYVLEGEMLFELEGEAPRVVCAGEAFWEPGGDVVHYSNANNRDDIPCRFVATMFCAPGRPMLTLVDDAELAARTHLRVAG